MECRENRQVVGLVPAVDGRREAPARRPGAGKKAKAFTASAASGRAGPGRARASDLSASLVETGIVWARLVTF
jgi:hypothetical protein